MWRKHLLPLGLWTLVWALFFATLLLGIERLPTGDFAGQFHAFVTFQAREMSAGRLPLWSPGSYGGIPFAADTQAAVFYPLRWLSVLFSLPAEFSYYLLELEGLLHIWLAGVFTYFLAYEMTSDFTHERDTSQGRAARLQAEQWAGLIAAVAFGLGGYLTSYPLLQLAVLESIVWLPLILYLLRRAVKRDRPPHTSPIPWLLFAAVALGMSALAGHPQTFLHVAYLSAAYYLFLTWQARWPWRSILKFGFVTIVTAAGIAAAAYLPAALFVPLTVRGDVSYEFVSSGFPLLQALQTVVPGYRSLWLPQYVGLPTLFLAVIAWLGRRQWPEKLPGAETLFWSGAIVLAAWLALGDKGVLYELAYRIAPGFSLFRQQERLVSIVVLGLALLAAQGYVIWVRVDWRLRRSWLRRAALLLAMLLLLVGFVDLLSRTAVGQNEWSLIWIRQWLILAALIALLWPNPRAPWMGMRGLALLALLSLDLFFPVRRAMNLEPESPAAFWPQPPWLESLQSEELARIDGQNLFHANLGELYGLEDIKGISPLKPQFAADLGDLPRPLRWRLLNVHYVLAERPLEESLVEIASIEQSIFPEEAASGYVYRFADSLPRAWMVHEIVSAADDGIAFELLREPGFDPERQVILTAAEGLDLSAVASPPTQPEVTAGRVSPTELAFHVTSDTAGILVISEWALPGWRATLDGDDAPLLTADYALQGLYIPAGAHSVTMSYSGAGALVGLGISLLTLVVALIAAWRWRPVVLPRSRVAQGREAVPRFTWSLRLEDTLTAIQWRWLMLGITLLAFGLRIFLLAGQELRGDEAFSYLYTQLPVGQVIPELIQEGDPHSPLHYLLLNVWADLAGISELALRTLSLLSGFLLIPVLYQLGRHMAGRRAGALAAFLAALSPSLIWLAQDVRNQYTLAILLTALATWVLVRLSSRIRQDSLRREVGLWLLYALLAAAAVYAHYYAIFALFSHGLFLWYAPHRRRLLGSWAASGLLAALLFLPWLIVSLAGLVDAGQLSDPAAPELARYLVRVGRELVIGATLAGRWTRWMVLAVAAGVFAGFLALRRPRPGWAAMLLGWIGSALLVIYLVQFSRGTFNTFYISVAAPAWLLLLSAGILLFWQQGRWMRIALLALLVVYLAATIASLRNLYFDPLYSRTLGYRAVALVLQQEGRDGDLFIAHFPDPSLDYYLRQVDIPREMYPATTGQTTAEIEEALSQAAQEYDRLWLVPYNNSVWDPDNVVPNWLTRHNLLEQTLPVQRLTLNRYRPLHSAVEVVTPIAQRIGESFTLDGAWLTVDGRPALMDQADRNQPLTLPPDAEMAVTLLWTALDDSPGNYTAFVHLLDENGGLIAQHDGIPAQGLRPTSTWGRGEQIVDTHIVDIPPRLQGSGQIVVGLYDTETLQRAQFSSGIDTLKLADVRFE